MTANIRNFRGISLCFLLFPFYFSAFTAETQTIDWPRWRGPDGNGITSESDWDPGALENGPKVLWQAALGVGFSSASVAGELVYAMGNAGGKDTIYCLNFETGDVVWSYSYSCRAGSYPGPRATPTIDEGIVYTLSQEGHLFALDAETGEVRWQKHLPRDLGIRSPGWGFAGSPVVVGNTLLLNAGRSGLALNKRNGSTLWDSGSGPGGYAAPLIYIFERKTYAAIFGIKTIYGVEIDRGNVAWSYPWATRADVNAADPLVHDGMVFVSSAYNKGSAVVDFSERSPEVVWRSDIFESHFSSFVLIDGYIYGNDGDARRASSGVFRCVDFRTGEEMWSAKLGFGSIIAAGDKLVMLNAFGGVFVAKIDPRNYVELASASLPRNQYWTPPILVRKRLLIRNLKGELFCIDVS